MKRLYLCIVEAMLLRHKTNTMIYLVNTIERTIKGVNIADVPEIAGITNEEFSDIYLNDPTRINGDLDSHFFFYDYETAKEEFPICD